MLALLLAVPVSAVETALPGAPESAALVQTAVPSSPLSPLTPPLQTLPALAAASFSPAASAAPVAAPRSAFTAAGALAAAASSPPSAQSGRAEQAQAPDAYRAYFDGSLISKAATLAAEHHIDEPDAAALYRRALSGLLEKEPHLAPHAQAASGLDASLRAARPTFGFSWSKPAGQLPRVTAVLPGSPAERAGLRPGDVVMSAAGENPYRMTGDQFGAHLAAAARAGSAEIFTIARAPQSAFDRDELALMMSGARMRVPASHPDAARGAADFFSRLVASLTPERAVAAVDAALKTMLGALDRHTRYLEPSTANAFREEMKGEKAGIGVAIIQKDGVNRVARVFKGTPAERAGVQADDILLAIDGRSVTGIPLQEIQEDLRRPDGAAVRLTVERAGARVNLAMSAAHYQMPMTYSQIFDGGRGYVRLREFSQTSHEELVTAIRELVSQGATSLVLDLRYNPGGDLFNAVNIAGAFLPEGADVGSTRSGRESERAQVMVTGEFVDLPLVVLINRHSASASELVSSALKDHGRAEIVGEPSYGKGSGQRGFALPNGGSAVITMFKWYGPNGGNVGDEPIGVQPTVWVPISDDEFKDVARRLAAAEGRTPLDPSKDAALAKALELLAR